jgi:putative transposase
MDEGSRIGYPSDLSNAQWEQRAALIPLQVSKGHQRTVDLREIMNAIFSILQAGCPWHYLPPFLL